MVKNKFYLKFMFILVFSSSNLISGCSQNIKKSEGFDQEDLYSCLEVAEKFKKKIYTAGHTIKIDEILGFDTNEFYACMERP